MIPLALPVAELSVEIEALEPVRLPPFPGSKLEGAFGRVLYELCCTRRDREVCAGCPLQTVCPYGLLYAPERPEWLPVASLGSPPRPLVFAAEPGSGEPAERWLAPGEGYAFGLLLAGSATRQLPYAVASLRAMGEAGIGLGRGRFAVRRVVSRHPYTGEARLVASHGDPAVRLEPVTVSHEDLPPLPAGDGVRLEFQTFAHLRESGRMAPNLHFPVLVRALQRRLSNLEQLYGGGASRGADFSLLPQLARRVETLRHDLRPARQARSGHGGPPVVMHGLIGTVEYGGDLAPFATLLRYGELLGVGKWAHFGLGRYRVHPLGPVGAARRG